MATTIEESGCTAASASGARTRRTLGGISLAAAILPAAVPRPAPRRRSGAPAAPHAGCNARAGAPGVTALATGAERRRTAHAVPEARATAALQSTRSVAATHGCRMRHLQVDREREPVPAAQVVAHVGVGVVEA